jgi:hypothetical protein
MNSLRISKRALSCALFFLIVVEQTRAELLVEIHNTGFRNLTSGQPEMGFSFRLGVPGSQWQMFLTQGDEGNTFSAPSTLLAIYDQYLTSGDSVFVDLTCCEGIAHGFVSPPAINFGHMEGDSLTVTRIAPNLGPNLIGYRLTDITQTIDDITITPIPGSGGLYNRSGAHIVRIYGDVIPEPVTMALGLIGFMLSVCSLRIRLAGC